MRERYWPVVEAVAGDLVALRADAELAQVSAYLSAHQDAGDLFDFLDELAGPGGAALARGAHMAQHYAAVREACQRLRDVPAAELPEAVGWAARLLRYRVSQLPPARVQPPVARPTARPAPPPAAAERPGPAAAPAGRLVSDAQRPGPLVGRPGGPSPAARPGPPRPAGPRLPPQAPAAAGAPPGHDRPGRTPAGPLGAPPARAPRPGGPPAERAPIQPAAQQAEAPAPPPRRPSTMEEMLRALQAQYGSAAGGPESLRPAARTESRRERLRREQEEIRERYRRQREEPDDS